MHDLIIVGAGGFGREVLSWAMDVIATGTSWRVKGFLDDNPAALDPFNIGLPVLESFMRYEPQPQELFVCAIGKPSIRRMVHARLQEREGSFVTLIHPTAVVADTARLGTGVILCPFTLVSAHAHVDDGTAVYYHSSVDHDARVGRFCQISAHCDITGSVSIGDEVFLGSHASVLPNVSVGHRAVIGAGAVVTTSVTDGATVIGVPARPSHRIDMPASGS